MGKFFEGGGSSLISGAIGMIGGAISDRRNYKNQLKLMERQQQYNKELGKIDPGYRDWETDRKSTRLNSSHRSLARMPSSA